MSHSLLLRSSDALTDAELVARARAGDGWGREMLYRRHAPRLLAMSARLLGSRSEGEEVVQDTFLTAFVELGSLRDPGAVGAWLGQIAIRLARRRIRRTRMLRLFGLDRGADDATLASLAARDGSPEERAELALIDERLCRLRPAIRIAWMLRRVEGLELTEVAALCGCSLATAKRRITAAESAVRGDLGVARGEP